MDHLDKISLILLTSTLERDEFTATICFYSPPPETGAILHEILDFPMNYLSYLIFGPYTGKLVLLCLLVGLVLFVYPGIILPIHGYKLKKIIGGLLVSCALITGSWLINKGLAPMTAQHRMMLIDQANKLPQKQKFEGLMRIQAQNLTEIDFVILRRSLHQMHHPHFQKKRRDKP